MLNKVQLIGNVGQDPDIRHMADGRGVANFSLATSERWKDKHGEKQEKTEWHRCVAFDPLSKLIEQYVGKGSRIYCEGKLQTRQWEDRDGGKRYTTEIILREIKFLGGRDDRGGGRRQEEQQRRGPDRTRTSEDDDFDEDIPF